VLGVLQVLVLEVLQVLVVQHVLVLSGLDDQHPSSSRIT
jgi:hypothetical protein